MPSCSIPPGRVRQLAGGVKIVVSGTSVEMFAAVVEDACRMANASCGIVGAGVVAASRLAARAGVYFILDMPMVIGLRGEVET